MPEGHVTHRAARLQGKRFVDKVVNASSPQGRFSAAAAKIDGALVDGIDASGKNLFYWFSTGDVVHVHLGLVGKFRLSKAPFPKASPNARLLLWTADHQMQLTGPNTCDLITPDYVKRVKQKLGPDPIADASAGRERFVEALSKRKVPIGRALLDQKVAAGLGNVFRSELLFLAAIHPQTPSCELSADAAGELWRIIVVALKSAEKRGRIVTVTADDAGVSPSKLDASEALYAYHRDGSGCRRCGSLIHQDKVDSRSIWWCPTCQPSQGPAIAKT